MYLVTKKLCRNTNTYLSKVIDPQGQVCFHSTEIVVDNSNLYIDTSREFSLVDDAINYALNGF